MTKKRRTRTKVAAGASPRGTPGSQGSRGSEGAAKRAAGRTDSAAAAPRVPLWLPATLFVVLAVWLFRAFIFSDKMLFGSDTLSLGYVARAFYAKSLKAFTFPHWNPQILGGTPFLEALTGGDSLYPPSAILLFLLAPFRALGWKLVLHICAAGFFMFGWVRALKASRAAALVAGVGYTLSPFMVSLVYPGDDGKIFVTALAPLLFWATERFFVRPGAKSFAGVGLVVALVILTTHFEMAYFLFGGVGLYAIFRTAQVWRGTAVGAGDGDDAAKNAPPGADDQADPAGEGASSSEGAAGAPVRRPLTPAAGRLGLFVVAALMGAATAGVQLIPAAHYVTHYSRRIQTTARASGQTGRAWSSSWSMHPEEAMSEIIPEFVGYDVGGSAWAAGTYWGRNVFKLNTEYAGLVLLLLSLASFAGGARREVRWFLAGLGGLAFLFALGTHTPVWGIFYALVPGIRMFRAPSQAMILFAFASTTLAALGVDRLLVAAHEDDDHVWKPVMRVLWVAAGVMVVLALLAASGALTSFWTSVVYRGIGDQRLQILRVAQPFIVRGAFIAAVLALATAGLAWAVRRGYLAPAALVVGLVVLVTVDEARIDAPFIQVEDFQQWATPDADIQALLDREKNDPQPYRLLDFENSAQDVKPAMFGIELAAGHHPNDLARYRELIGMVGSGLPTNMGYANIRRLLNVRYILWPEQEMGAPPKEFPVISATTLSGRPYEALLADVGLPRARLVTKAVVKPDGEDVQYMISPAFDPDSEVVLSEPAPIALDGGPVKGDVTWEERTPNHLRLHVTSDRAALLVIADNWFPAWHATVDGKEAPVLRAYHTLRAIPVQAGDHTVEMYYHSVVVARSLWVTVVALLILCGLGGWGFVRERRRAS
jgi:hypothetical protein